MLTSLDDEAAPAEVALGDDLQFWTVAARFALELLYQQRFVPTLRRKDGEGFVARWSPIIEPTSPTNSTAEEADDWQRFNALAKSMPHACRALGWNGSARGTGARPDAPQQAMRVEGRGFRVEGDRASDLLRDFLQEAIDGVARSAGPLFELGQPRRYSVGERWLKALQAEPIVEAEPGELDAFRAELEGWVGPSSALTAEADTFRVCFRLDPPGSTIDAGSDVSEAADADDGGQSKHDPATPGWTLRYVLQATDDPSLLVPASDVWRRRTSTARFLNRKFDNPQERLLAGLGRASRLFPMIESSLKTARPEMCGLTTAEAYEFVREKALLLRASGFGVLVPGIETRLGLRVRLGRKHQSKVAGSGLFNWQSIVEYDWQLALGDEVLSREEFEALARLKEPLVQVRGRWIELSPEQIEQALTFFQKQGSRGQMTLQEALKLSLAPNGEQGLPVTEVVTEGWIDDLMRQMRDGGQREPASEPPGFVGRLREYQKVGVSWLASLHQYGLGACLADDMGLGKTIQIIAILLSQRNREPADAIPPALLVCPTSVVGNWHRELARFAPSLRVLVHHGSARNKEDFVAEASRHDVVISTYALLHRDETELTAVEWSDVILDEAQNIKNAATKAAQTARKLKGRWRAALTGTPVENRLADLWSIFHFLNPGYLGSGEDFKKKFAQPIERARDAATTERLKKLVSPFVLRRVKSDRSIIEDLPEKNEMKVFCNLTREQVTLYEAVVQQSLRQIEEAEGLQRCGLVLAALTKLKQVCNHPAQFLHDASQLDGRSGKLIRLGEMLEEVLAVDDRALVFSQYAEMGKMLKAHLEKKFGREVLFLHGGTPAAERDRMVARFQTERKGPHLFVLSLKAGGTGLNLTAANHVFHFDRWWNPAVENQATDRAFRIGQTRDVQVHKFICAGTFEEALDQLIEHKIELSEAIVGTSEAWITEMTTEELRGLFALRPSAEGLRPSAEGLRREVVGGER
ncbi:MAG: DEAD/DEAH box helicase [Chloroflexi bacterium]|nr:DEAD/DEAH box helicase [Chloroflexota bacterium]